VDSDVHHMIKWNPSIFCFQNWTVGLRTRSHPSTYICQG